ncbi:MAG: hypothetical protein DRJ08_07405 [Acidobacteria bacterium]|nr:MAG: hypothetical protein DRJ08_07405 [Acidobacteriota bacterium]
MFRSNSVRLIFLTLIVLCFASMAFGEEEVAKEKKISGKDLYKSHCKMCHGEDADAGEYTPMSLIEEQWEEFFDELWVETHEEVACPKDEKKTVTDMWSKEMLKAVRKFCIDHAADSEQPMTCG